MKTFKIWLLTLLGLFLGTGLWAQGIESSTLTPRQGWMQQANRWDGSLSDKAPVLQGKALGLQAAPGRVTADLRRSLPSGQAQPSTAAEPKASMGENVHLTVYVKGAGTVSYGVEQVHGEYFGDYVTHDFNVPAGQDVTLHIVADAYCVLHSLVHNNEYLQNQVHDDKYTFTLYQDDFIIVDFLWSYYDIEYEGVYYRYYDSGVSVCNGPVNYTGDMVIPDQIPAPYGTGMLSVVQVESKAFEFCDQLTSIDLGHLTDISFDAFRMCTALRSVKGTDVTSINASAFEACTSLESIDLPACLTIANSVFSRCESLRIVGLPSLLRLYEFGFYGCEQLHKVYCPNLCVVDSCAFMSCPNLSEVYFDAITSIGQKAFAGCDRLSDFYTDMLIPGKWSEPFSPEILSSATLHVPAGCKAGYQETEGWKEFGTILEDNAVTLTINQTDKGSTIVAVPLFTSHRVNLTPAAGYHIQYVSFNGMDVTRFIGPDNIYVTPKMIADAVIDVKYAR